MDPRVTDDLVWVPELEMALEYQGTWRVQVLPAPPMNALRAECQDVPLWLEVYALDPEEFRRIDSVGRDLIHSRLSDVRAESYQETPRGLDVAASGLEQGRPTDLVASVTFDNDIFYVMAFCADPGVLEKEQWRTEAMLASVTFGRHESYGTGLEGLVNMMGAQLSEPEVVLGHSRAQLGLLRRFAPHPGPSSQKVVVDPALIADREPPKPISKTPAIRSVLDRDDLADFERRLTAANEAPAPPPSIGPPPWPAPWEPLPNVQPHHQPPRRPEGLLALTANASQTRRAAEIIALAESMPAEVAFYAEKVFGVGSSFAHRELEPFGVVGLERVPMAIEALLQERQGELPPGETLPLGPPRRALSPLGRQLPDDAAVPLSMALEAMCRDDDATAADLVGWRLGWRQIQARLPALGLAHHSILTPARARALAFTNLSGPLEGLDLAARIDFWRSIDENTRRETIGQLHKAHIETPLDQIAEAFLEVAEDPAIDPMTKSRWALALGPRGCAQEYGALFAALMRGEVLGPPHRDTALGFMRPCVGDPLSGAVPGVELSLGKLGQTFGTLVGGGILSKLGGSEVAICVLAKHIRTIDMEGFLEQMRLLSGRLYLHVSRL